MAPVISCWDIAQLPALSALKVMFYGEHQLLQQLKQLIVSQWPQQLHLTFSRSTLSGSDASRLLQGAGA